jgi:Bacterial regulatory proteins, luxR family
MARRTATLDNSVPHPSAEPAHGGKRDTSAIHTPGLTVSLVISGCGVVDALYRGDYGLGGTVGMIGRPADQAEWRAVNLAGAATVLVLALQPAAALPQRTVADLVAEGLSNPRIGDRLYISRGRCKTHLAHVFAKLDLASRAQLAALVTTR